MAAPLQSQLNRPDLLRDKAFVGGEWIGSQVEMPVNNPATGAILGYVPALGALEAERAVATAYAAQPAWARLTGKERSTVLRRWFDLIIRHADDLATIMTAEQGKPVTEARGEIVYAASFIEWFSEEAKRTYGDVIPGHLRDKRLVVTKNPVGVVAAVTPWNFPAAMITRKAGPALAVGCSMVLKPSEFTPLSALALAVLGEEAGLPAGVFSVVTGRPEAIGEVLTSDYRVRKFSFTGSTPVGKMLAAKCASTVKRVSLELGGNAPFIVFDDADLDAAVAGAIQSKFRNAGQTCVCANRVLVQSGIYDEFAVRLVKATASLKLGDGAGLDVQVGPLINAAALEKAKSHVEDAIDRGGKVAFQASVEGLSPDGSFFPPTVIVGATPDMRVANEETFGPVAALFSFDTEEQAIELANDTPAGLASYIFSRDASRVWRVAEALQYGMVGINTGLISTEVAPFGGIKESGLGREGSHYGVDDYLETKLMCFNIAEN